MVPTVVEGVEHLVLHVCSVAAEVVQLVLPESEACAPLSQEYLDPSLLPGSGSSTVEHQGGHSCVAQGPGGGGGGGVQVHQAGADVAGCLVAGVCGSNQSHLLRAKNGVRNIVGVGKVWSGHRKPAGKNKIWNKMFVCVTHPWSYSVLALLEQLEDNTEEEE